MKRLILFVMLLSLTINRANAADISYSFDAGSLIDEAGQLVLLVDPGQSINVTVSGAGTESILGYGLNFENSDLASGELAIGSWVNDSAWPLVTDSLLNPVLNDVSVSAGSLAAASLPQDFGSFQLVAPIAVGDYLLTVDSESGPFQTSIVDGAGPISIDDFGDVIVRVIPEPNSIALSMLGIFVLTVKKIRRS